MKTLVHCHSEYSTGDAILTTDKLCKVAKENGFEALTLTDHGVMGGSYAFLTSCKKYEIKPIIGVELYFHDELEKTKENKDRTNYHIVAVAKNETGYRNLIKLSSIGWVKGFYYRPRVDMSMLKQFCNSDIKITTACMGGILSQHLNTENYDAAYNRLCELKSIFGKDNVFVEIQFIEVEGNKSYVKNVIKFKERYPNDVKLIFGQDVHFAKKEDKTSFHAFHCIKSKLTWANRREFGSDYGFIRQVPEIMIDWVDLGYDKFVDQSYVEEAISNASSFANDIEEYNIAQKPVLPSMADMGFAQIELKDLCVQGLKTRGILEKPQAERVKYVAQLKKELTLINEFGFEDYFIMQKLIIDIAKQIGVLVGPGRGSSAGSLVNYLVNNTNVDPLKYGLMFERFINPARKELPDIDTDYSDIRAVQDKLVEMFGTERVVKIVTYATFQYKGLLHDLGRIFEYPINEIMDISRKLDHIKSLDQMSLEEVIEICPELGAWLRRHEQDKLTLHVRNLIGVIRHKSQHAAGILIGSSPLWNYFPLERVSTELVSAFTEGSRSKELMHLGGVKFDVLGLNTLQIQKDAMINIAKRWSFNLDNVIERFDSSKIDDNDQNVLQNIFRTGDTLDIFQFESDSARRMLKTIVPDNIMELCIINAINRPGPLQAGYEQIYTDVKFGVRQLEQIHPIVDAILSETNGVIVYQEQVIRIARELGDLTDAEAEFFRKLVFKLDRQKNADVLDERMRQIDLIVEKWTKNALTKGMTQQQIDVLWAKIKGFLDYAFNKSHALSYAMVAYVSACIKYYYPIEWHAAYINNIVDDSAKLQQYIKYLNLKGIKIIPPRYGTADKHMCTIVDDDTIMLGVNIVKNCSLDVIGHSNKHKHVINSFLDFFILAQSYPSTKADVDKGDKGDVLKVNKRSISSLIAIGFFDDLPAICEHEPLSRGRLIKFFYYLTDKIRTKIKRDFTNNLSLSEIKEKYHTQIEDAFGLALKGDEPPFHEYSVEMSIMKCSTKDHPLLKFSSKVADIQSRVTGNVMLGEIVLLKQKFTKNKTRYFRATVEDIMTGDTYDVNYWNNLIDKYNPKEGQYGIFILSEKHPVYGTADLMNFVEVR